MTDNIITERLILRKFKISDVKEFLKISSNENVYKYMTWNGCQTMEEVIKILITWEKTYESNPGFINFAITLKENDLLIGGINNVSFENGIPEVGFYLGEDYWNKGYMSEALRAFIPFLNSLGYNRIKIDACVENIASNKVIQKCGGKLIGTYKLYVDIRKETWLINSYIIEKGEEKC